MAFEKSIAKLNEAFFFKEFTFSSNKFKPTPQEELELADSLIWLDDLLITFQVKERGKAGDSTKESEAKWFKDKVVTKGTKQIRDTLSFLDIHSQIELENHRGIGFCWRSRKLRKYIR